MKMIFEIAGHFVQIKTQRENFYGISDVELIKAVGLDIDGANAGSILEDAIRNLN